MAYFMALTIKFLERTKQYNENFLYAVQSWFSDRNSNWVDFSYKSDGFLCTKCPYIVMRSLVVLLWLAALYFHFHVVIVMVSCFIFSHSHWWHCYDQLLYTFRQSMVALLWSASSATSWAAQILQHCMMLLVCQFIYLFNFLSKSFA
jgi:hypothetical protein